MRKVLIALTDTVQILTFIVVSVLAVADLLQLVGPGFLGIDWSSQITKIILLVVGMIGTAQVIERRLHLLEIRDKVKDVEQKVNTLHVKAQPTAVFISSRGESYKVFKDALKQLPMGTQILRTQFEKPHRAPNTWELQEESDLIKLWNQRVLQNDFSVEQIVQISSQHDLDKVIDLVTNFHDVPNFNVHVMLAPPVKPHFDFTVLGEQYAFLDFSVNAASPRETDACIFITDPSTVRFLKQYFNLWWNRHNLSIKTREGINEELIQKIRKNLPLHCDDEKLNQSFNLALQLISDPWLEQSVKELVYDYESVIGLQEEVFIDKAKNFIIACNDDLNKLTKGFTIMDSEGVLEMRNILRRARRELNGTSYFDNEAFWTSTTGNNFELAHKEVIERGIIFNRVFILTPEEKQSPAMLEVMRRQKEMGIKVFVVGVDELTPNLRQDILIQDNKLVYRNEMRVDNTLMSKILIDRNEVIKAQRIFDLILLRAKPFGEQSEAHL